MRPDDEGAPEPRADLVADLAARWRRARQAALESPGDERERLRRTFENSLRLGQGFVRFHGTPLAPEQVPEVLGKLGAPCLSGRWSEVSEEAGYRLERTPCQSGATAGFCDHWREAIGGLVLGLTGGVRHTRHLSAGYGAESCLDVFYADPESSLRYGSIPPEFSEGLESVRNLVQRFRGHAEVKFLGVSEGELLYQLTSPRAEATGCSGSGVQGLEQIVERCLLKHFPALKPRELSPRPVLDARASSPDDGTHP